ncbi:MAG: hypothetical protein P8X98_09000 [Woeseiaceae bacterium]
MKSRTERDSMGEVEVPAQALYGAQTQRAVDNFTISRRPMPARFIRALAQLKASAARANRKCGTLDPDIAEALEAAEDAAATGRRRDRDYTTEWALAFSNRGVLRARMGDAKGAAHDFRMAIDLHGDSQLPVHNMARLHHEIEDDALAAK